MPPRFTQQRRPKAGTFVRAPKAGTHFQGAVDTVVEGMGLSGAPPPSAVVIAMRAMQDSYVETREKPPLRTLARKRSPARKTRKGVTAGVSERPSGFHSEGTGESSFSDAARDTLMLSEVSHTNATAYSPLQEVWKRSQGESQQVVPSGSQEVGIWRSLARNQQTAGVMEEVTRMHEVTDNHVRRVALQNKMSKKAAARGVKVRRVREIKAAARERSIAEVAVEAEVEEFRAAQAERRRKVADRKQRAAIAAEEFAVTLRLRVQIKRWQERAHVNAMTGEPSAFERRVAKEVEDAREVADREQAVREAREAVVRQQAVAERAARGEEVEEEDAADAADLELESSVVEGGGEAAEQNDEDHDSHRGRVKANRGKFKRGKGNGTATNRGEAHARTANANP